MDTPPAQNIPNACAETQKCLSLGKVWTHLGKKNATVPQWVPLTQNRRINKHQKYGIWRLLRGWWDAYIYMYIYQKSGWILWFHLTCMFQVFCENSVPTPTPPVTSRVAIASELGESEGWKKGGDSWWFSMVQSKQITLNKQRIHSSIQKCKHDDTF